MAVENERPAAQYVVPSLPSPPAQPEAAADVVRPHRPVAILVAHGMGQQIPFQTLDQIAEGLRNVDRQWRPEPPKPIARAVIAGDERLSRLELNLQVDAIGTTRDVHLYEAYWAPLTEGQVTLRDVTRFLVTAGLSGIASGWRPFKRWLFGEFVEFPAPIRTVLYLAAALAVIVSLVWLNAVIVGLVAMRMPFRVPVTWWTEALFGDITTVLNAVILTFVIFGVALWATSQRRSKTLRKAAGVPAIALLVAAIGVTLAAAVMSVVILAFHMSRPASASFFTTIGWAGFVQGFNDVAEFTIFLLVGAVAAALLGFWLMTFFARLTSSVRADRRSRWLTMVVFASWAAIVVSVALLAGWAAATVLPIGQLAEFGRHAIAWPLVALAAAIVRRFLIQFVGDVVAYVQSQMLDRFFELRQRIRDLVFRRARTIYNMEEYDEIILVGHSLGSVVVYDALNRLLIEEANMPGAPPTASRTRMLLTVGSPLDKTAFLFGTQARGTEAREALAASVQPLISDRKCRPRWVNVHSPWDIISDPLEYYDLPDRSNVAPVENIVDTDATALLAAHDEYWRNPTVFRMMAAALGAEDR